MYDKLAAKVNNIDTSDFVLKTKYQTDKIELEKKIPDVTYFVKKIRHTESENKIPDVSSLAIKTALTAVGNKIPSIRSLVKRTDYDTKITKIKKKLTDHNHDNYITTPEFNIFAASAFNARLPHGNLISKTDFDAKLSSLYKILLQIKQNICLLKMNWKSWKHLIWVILLAKVILKKMVHKII